MATLNVNQMPQHYHTVHGISGIGNKEGPVDNVWARKPRDDDYSSLVPNVQMNANAIGDTGGSQSHENRQPYLALYHVIALQGIFPSRN